MTVSSRGECGGLLAAARAAVTAALAAGVAHARHVADPAVSVAAAAVPLATAAVAAAPDPTATEPRHHRSPATTRAPLVSAAPRTNYATSLPTRPPSSRR